MSLTKATFFKNAAPAKPHLLGEYFGDKVYVKKISEFQRSRRLAGMFDPKTEGIRPEAMEKARAYVVIDHVCDEDGKPLFTDKDAGQILSLDADTLDPFVHDIEAWRDGDSGKPEGK